MKEGKCLHLLTKSTGLSASGSVNFTEAQRIFSWFDPVVVASGVSAYKNQQSIPVTLHTIPEIAQLFSKP